MSQPATIQTIPTLFGRANRRAIVALYAASAFLFWAAQYIFLPTLPTYAQTKVGDLATVGIVLSMYGLWQALVRLPLGIASDWLGARKPFIVIGLAFGAVGAWMMATSNDAVGLAIGRAITGASAGTWVVLIVAFSALFPPREAVRASALLTSFNSFGRILATAVNGSLIDLGGYTLPFFVAAGLGLLSAIILFPIDETRRAPKAPSLSGIGGLLMRRDVFLPTMLSTVMQYVLWTTSFGFVLVLAKQLGATNVLQSLIVTLHITITVLGNFIASSRKNPFSNRQLITASFILLFIGTMIAALASSLAMLFVAPIFLGLALGIGYPMLMGMSIERVSDPERTIAMGLHQAIYAIGMFVGPALSGVIADHIGLQPMFAVTAFAGATLGLFGTRWLSDKPMV